MEEILLKNSVEIKQLIPQWKDLSNRQIDLFFDEVFPYCLRTFKRLGRTSKKYKELHSFLELASNDGSEKKMHLVFAICSIYMRGNGL